MIAGGARGLWAGRGSGVSFLPMIPRRRGSAVVRVDNPASVHRHSRAAGEPLYTENVRPSGQGKCDRISSICLKIHDGHAVCICADTALQVCEGVAKL
jgi:hypothetical protein